MSDNSLEISNLFSVAGKCCLVTGGTSGIGLMITRGFVKNGARVYIAARKASDCESIAQQLTTAGPGKCIAIAGDVSTEEGCKKLAAEIASRETQLHVLVNNAGATWGEPFETYSDAAWNKLLNLNVKSIFFLTRACHSLLKAAATEEDPARVINLGSIDGIRIPTLETYAYSASKAAVHHLTKVLANRLARDRITVNAIAAGAFYSRMMKATLDRAGDIIKSNIPLGRTGSESDAAGTAIWLSSRAGAWTTGSVIVVDGGHTIISSM